MAGKKRPVVVLWNEASGWSDDRAQAQQVRQALSEAGSPITLERMKKGENITARGSELIADGPKLLVAAGGDGTINAVASAVVNTDSTLGVIPAGTLNHFARDLAIPLSPERAAATILNGQEIHIDVGDVNGRLFLNNVVIGLYPVYRAAREAYERKGLGSNKLTRLIAVLRSLARVIWTPPRIKLTLTLENGRTLRVRTAFVLIANNEHEVEQWNIGHRRCLEEGQLWIYILKRSSRWSLIRFFLRFLFKRFSRHEAFEIFKARQVRVDHPSQNLKIGLDGEILRLETPLDFRSRPGALRVIAPANYKSEITVAKGA